MQNKPSKSQRRSPSQARSRATVEAILEASARILRENGEAKLTTNKVAERAGVGIGSLYGYFRNKAEILDSLADQILEEDERAVARELNRNEPELLRRVIRVLLQRHCTDKRLRRIVLHHHVRTGHGREHSQRACSMIAEVEKALYPETLEIRPDAVTTFVAANAVLGVCRALTDEVRVDIAHIEVEAELIKVATHLLNGG